MKSTADLVKGWLKKADSDLANARTCLASGEALDTVYFHAQQAAEKCLKAYLIQRDIDFPFIHNLEKLVELCAGGEAAFATLKPIAQELTPYAVELRYDYEFWPSVETAQKALTSATVIRGFVIERVSIETNGA